MEKISSHGGGNQLKNADDVKEMSAIICCLTGIRFFYRDFFFHASEKKGRRIKGWREQFREGSKMFSKKIEKKKNSSEKKITHVVFVFMFPSKKKIIDNETVKI